MGVGCGSDTIAILGFTGKFAVLTHWNNVKLHRRTWSLAWPMILSNLTVPLTGLVDTAVIGHLDQSHFLGATAIGSLIVTMLMWLMGFLRMSTTGLTAQAFGADDALAERQVLLNAIITAMGLSFVMLLMQSWIWRLAIAFMAASDSVLQLAGDYYDIRIWALPALLLRYVFIGWLLGRQDAKSPLLILSVTNLVNIGLDILLVVYWEMAVAGAAWASLIADYAGILVGIVVIYGRLRQKPVAKTWLSLLDQAAWQRLLQMNRELFIRTLALELVFYLQTSVGASMGDAVLAANSVLMNFTLIMAFGLDGFAHAVEALAGKSAGSQSRDELMAAIQVSGLWSFAASLFFTVLFALIGHKMIDWMTDIPAVNGLAKDYLIYLIWIPLVAVWCYWLDGVFIGITRVKEMRNTMLIAVLGIFIPTLFLVKFVGNHGIWLAFYALLLARAIGLGYYLWQLDRSQQVLGDHR
jgi:MATE family multidrug resistance protein